MKKITYHVTAALTALFTVLSWVIPVSAKSIVYNETGPDSTTASLAAAANQNPTINVWNEGSLHFGQLGNPQTMINILGNVQDPDGSVASLTYRLNGGPGTALSIGPDGARLNNPGDFNVSLPVASLLNGTNMLLLTATDNSGGMQNKTVSFSYTTGRTWPLPYSTNWANASSLYDQAQVVDGSWQITANGIRPTMFGYDRLVALGDVGWSTYEVLVPITIHGFYPVSGDPGGVGVITRWQGHAGTGQPPADWTRLGAYAYISNRSDGLALRLDQNSPITQVFSFALNKTYLFKVRVELSPQSGGGRYSFKVWEKGQPEPSWNDPRFNRLVNVDDTANDLQRGSMLLVAHRADATFGDVSVCPLNVTYPLTIQRIGSGSVVAQPGKTSYACGEGVTLSAQAAPGWTFIGWTSDMPVLGNTPTISFNMTRPVTITANFRQGQPVEQGVRIYFPQITK